MWDHFDLMNGPCTPTCCTLLWASFFSFLLAGSEHEPPVIGSTSFVAEAASAWLPNEAISSKVEVSSPELLGAYSKSEDNALSAAFGSRKKKRLNRVFDDIGFVYHDYLYPPRGQKRKGAASGKVVASATPSEAAPKRKKLKVLTHRSRYIETAIVPEFGEETSSVTKAKEPAPPTQKIEEPVAMPKAPSAKLAKPKTDNIEERRVEGTKILEVLSPSAEVTVPKAQKGLTTTPKRKRMASVLDVLETVKASSSILSGKIAEALKIQVEAETRPAKVEGAVNQASGEARPSEPVDKQSSKIEKKAAEEEATEQSLPEKTVTPAPKALKENIEYIIHHASRKKLSKEEEREAQHYA
jgi:hypothetical protein